MICHFLSKTKKENMEWRYEMMLGGEFLKTLFVEGTIGKMTWRKVWRRWGHTQVSEERVFWWEGIASTNSQKWKQIWHGQRSAKRPDGFHCKNQEETSSENHLVKPWKALDISPWTSDSPPSWKGSLGQQWLGMALACVSISSYGREVCSRPRSPA